MEITPSKPSELLLRFFLFFLFFSGLWSFIATSYAFFKMNVLQWGIQLLYPEHTPFIRDPGFLQGYAVAVLVFLALFSARWSKDNLHQWKKYPWVIAGSCFLVLIILDITGNLLEISAQRSTSFFLNYSVTWLLSVGTITLPFLCWFYLESRMKPA